MLTNYKSQLSQTLQKSTINLKHRIVKVPMYLQKKDLQEKVIEFISHL